MKLKAAFGGLAKELETESDGRFTSTIVDPEANGGTIAEQISQEYGFRPMAASIFDRNTFWFYMMLKSGDQTVEVPLPEDFAKESLKRAIDAGLKRFATGFTKNIALSVPESMPPMPQYGIPGGGGPKFDALRELLSQEHTVTDADLAKGQVPGEADILLLAAPEELDEKKLFAVDQFLMQGGTVILAASPYQVDLQGQLAMSEKKTGLEEWLQHNGISIEKQMVLDPQNTPFPVPVQRNLGGFMIRETKLVNYPYFVDIRPDGMDEDSGITSGLQQVTLNWASPVTIDAEKNKGRKVIRLLESTDKSWLSSSTMIQPDFQTHGELGFAVEGKQEPHLLAAAVEGGFTSYFTGKPSPLLKKEKEDEKKQQTPAEEEGAEGGEGKEKEAQVIIRQLDKSPDTARIIVFGSSSFLSDTVLGISSSVMQTSYLGPVQLIANTVDWSLEDRGLLSIRGRSHFSRPLNPITKNQQLFWEYLNYGLVLLGLAIIWLLRLRIRKRTEARQLAFLQPETGRVSS